MLIAQAPLRISLFGGGSDLPAYLENNYGSVLSFAINRRVFLIGHPFTHRTGILLKYSTTEDVSIPEKLKHPIAREIFKRYGLSNMDIAVMSDVPAGTGLGSSSSFTVASIAFASAIRGIRKSPMELAKEACDIEINVLREHIGFQDQWASALGGINVLEFSPSGVSHRPVFLDARLCHQLESNIFLVPVGGTRSASQLLENQSKEIYPGSKAETLIRKLVELVPQGERALLHNMDDLGPLLNQAWLIKRELVEGITNPEIDKLYTSGLSAGATGGKLLGAGSGGYLAFYVPSGAHERFMQAINSRLSFSVSHQGAGVIHES
jgi:D-glycero-alpha-D-manno-heptose-7-phosphate kinase